MTTDNNSALCFNFEQLERLRGITGSFDLAILYGQLKFQANKTKLTNKKNGKKEIARTRKQVADRFGKGVTVTMERLAQLIGMGLVDKRIGMWKGRKRMFLSCNGEYELGVNARKLEMLNKYTGGIHQSVLLSWIAYWIEVRPYRGKGHKYTLISRKRAAALLDVDERTVDAYMKDLVDRGLINYDGRKRKFWSEWQYHVSLNKDFMNKIDAEWKELEVKRAKEKAESLLFRAKADASIRINKNHQVDIINNNTKECANHASGPLVDGNGIVILSKSQQNYLAEAVRRTLARCDVLTWGYETLMGHMRYVLGTPKNRESGRSFAHVINRAMFLVRKNLWQQPLGYLYYSEEAREAKKALEPKNVTEGCTVSGAGSIMLWDYGVEDKSIPYPAEIVAERKRLEGLGLSLEEVNQSLLAKFGEYCRPYLLKVPVAATKRPGLWGGVSGEHLRELAKTDPVIRKALGYDD